MPEKQYESFRVILPTAIARKYKNVAEEKSVPTTTILKMVLCESARDKIIIASGE